MAQSSDFKIPNPAGGGSTGPLPPGTQLPPGGVNTSGDPIVIVDPIGRTEAIIGGGLLIVLIIAFFFARRAVESNLIAGLARPRKAANAAWMLFIALTVLAGTLIFGYLGRTWLVMPVLVVMIVICVGLLAAFFVSFVSARRSSAVS